MAVDDQSTTRVMEELTTRHASQEDDEQGADPHEPEEDTSTRQLLEGPAPMSQSITNRLYISHFLSTWNSRLFEFGAVLFLASIYPNTLLPMSVYAMIRSASAMMLSPAIGVLIDRRDRLDMVRASIVGQRLAVAASCGILWILNRQSDMALNFRMGLFILVVLLACVEKLSSILNLVSIERDWVG